MTRASMSGRGARIAGVVGQGLVRGQGWGLGGLWGRWGTVGRRLGGCGYGRTFRFRVRYAPPPGGPNRASEGEGRAEAGPPEGPPEVKAAHRSRRPVE